MRELIEQMNEIFDKLNQFNTTELKQMLDTILECNDQLNVLGSLRDEKKVQLSLDNPLKTMCVNPDILAILSSNDGDGISEFICSFALSFH